ncbi:hypothetical protein HK098_000910 [Nowakowskiella sp. JEL0407]|nr:hypothetical protein HK098_000910 [Nowakowskiella sp. JEL0407]
MKSSTTDFLIMPRQVAAQMLHMKLVLILLSTILLTTPVLSIPYNLIQRESIDTPTPNIEDDTTPTDNSHAFDYNGDHETPSDFISPSSFNSFAPVVTNTETEIFAPLVPESSTISNSSTESPVTSTSTSESTSSSTSTSVNRELNTVTEVFAPLISPTTTTEIGTDGIFLPSYIELTPGSWVEWVWSGGNHTVTQVSNNTSCVPETGAASFGSPAATSGTFRHQFNIEGTFYYASLVDDQCQKGARGAVFVDARAALPPLAAKAGAAGNLLASAAVKRRDGLSGLVVTVLSVLFYFFI